MTVAIACHVARTNSGRHSRAWFFSADRSFREQGSVKRPAGMLLLWLQSEQRGLSGNRVESSRGVVEVFASLRIPIAKLVRTGCKNRVKCG